METHVQAVIRAARSTPLWKPRFVRVGKSKERVKLSSNSVLLARLVAMCQPQLGLLRDKYLACVVVRYFKVSAQHLQAGSELTSSWASESEPVGVNSAGLGTAF
jgi:hypothetical protein